MTISQRIDGGIFAAIATASLVGKLGFFVKFDTANPGNVVVASTNEKAVGVVVEEAAAGGAASIQFMGIAAVSSGGAVTVNDRIASSSTGQGVTGSTNPAGVAMESVGAANLMFACLLVR